MEEKYSLANDNGQDFVNDYAYIDKYNLSVRAVPHGLAYAMEDKGYFDLLVFVNDK
ncbi:MAG: hypothetical protein ACK5NF_07580 [Bacilli bacterium]